MKLGLSEEQTSGSWTLTDADVAALPTPSARPRVLLVDDDETLLRSLGRILRQHFDVQCEASPYRALVALEDDGPFAAVIADLTMPGLDGVDLLETAYAHSPETARILLTGNATVSSSIDAVNRAHVTNLLMKPVSPDELVATLRNAVLQYLDLTDQIAADEPDRAGSIDLTVDAD